MDLWNGHGVYLPNLSRACSVVIVKTIITIPSEIGWVLIVDGVWLAIKFCRGNILPHVAAFRIDQMIKPERKTS